MSRSHPTVSEFLSSNSEDTAKAFYRQVLLPNGTFKTTDRHRLDEVNSFSLPFIQALNKNHLKLMDTAASSGVTTIEWSRQLEVAGLSFEMLATDKLLSANLLTIAPGVKALVDDVGNAMHFDFFGHGMSPRISRTPLAPLKVALRLLFAVTHRWSKPSTPVAMMMAGNGIPAEADDLLSPTPKKWLGAFDVVRAANILHKAYFSSLQLALAIENLQKRLNYGGLLIITRTREHDGKNEASILLNDGGTLSIIGRLNGGSEVEFLLN